LQIRHMCDNMVRINDETSANVGCIRFGARN
jgi:hypothetical protein